MLEDKNNQIVDDAQKSTEQLLNKGSANIFSRAKKPRVPNLKVAVLFFVVIAIIVVLIFFLRVKPVYDKFHDMGESIGTTLGEITGGAVGSFRGYRDGQTDGKEAGLTADDTSVVVFSLQEIGKLEVLVADVKMTDLFEVGDKYKALFSMDGNVVFTVDLANAEYTFDERANTLSVILPQPDCELYVDEGSTTLLADWHKPLSNGRASEGANAYNQSIKNMQNEYKTSIANYDTLLDMARMVALRQVVSLASAASGTDKTVSVDFAP